MLFERSELLTKSTLQVEDAKPNSYVDYGLHGLVGDFENSLFLSFCFVAGMGRKQEAAKIRGFLKIFQVMLTPSVYSVLPR